MHFSTVVAAMALVSSAAAGTAPKFTCPPIKGLIKCKTDLPKTSPHVPKTPKAHKKGGAKKPKKNPTVVPVPAPGTTTKTTLHGDAVEIKTGTYAILHVSTGLFVSIDLVGGTGVAQLGADVALVSVTNFKLPGPSGTSIPAIVLSAGLDLELGLVLSGFGQNNLTTKGKAAIGLGADLTLGVGIPVGNQPSCSPYFQPVKCGSILDATKAVTASTGMAKIPVLGSALGAITNLAADVEASVGLNAIVDLVVEGVAEIAASVCLVAEANIDVKAQAVTAAHGSKVPTLDVMASLKTQEFLFVSVDAAVGLGGITSGLGVL